MHATVFDIDGTLIESARVDDDLYRRSVRYVLGDVRIRERLTEYDHVSDSGILLQIIEDNALSVDDELTQRVVTHFVQSLRDYVLKNGSFDEIPGAKEMLRSLHSSGNHFVAIATGGWSESAIFKLASAGFELDGIPVSASDNEHDRTKIMRAALDRPEGEFETITYYGDGPWDREACEALGWKFIAVGPTLGGIHSFLTPGDI